jgi:hypothetical protein
VRALRADRDTAPAAERIVGNEPNEPNCFKRARTGERAPGVAAAAAASEAAFAAGRAAGPRRAAGSILNFV